MEWPSCGEIDIMEYYRISQEEFFPKDIALNNLKSRVSWGRLGNENALGYYDFLALISTYNEMYQGSVSYTHLIILFD